ncbi:sialate O-acetylesterase [Paraprevotella clara]|uniref:sialate O-acetylesterase n=1 Tax=Paraprevotella clara TaxID=454154 RepID=UPI00300F5E42
MKTLCIGTENKSPVAQAITYSVITPYRPVWSKPAERLAIKVSDNGGEGGIAGKAEDMNLKLSDQAFPSLAGSWKYRVGCSLADMPPAPIYPEHSSFPSVFFNGMVHPCLEYPVKGVIWYQGCNNVGRAEEYESLFQTLITDWRKQSDDPTCRLPLVPVTADYLDRKLVQADSPWAALREAQSQAQHLAHTGMAANIDIGEAHDIHPKNKQRSGTPSGRHLTGRYLRTENTRPSTSVQTTIR